ncbi:hypothetical protein OA187_04545 [Candidatus Pelagibacter sp.]|nr:hypothetical protein [Candidatus Pelagibacter sp.]
MKKIIIKINTEFGETISKTINFDDFEEKNDKISLPKYIETNSEDIKKKYIDLVNSFPNYRNKKKKIIDNFNFEKNKNFFWISDFYEKSLYKNTTLINQFELIALDKLFNEIDLNKVFIEISDFNFRISVQNICKSKNINFQIINTKIFSINFKLNSFLTIILSFLKFLIFCSKRISIRGKIDWNFLKKQNIKNIFINYSAYTDIDKSNSFNSEYWKELLKNHDLINNTLWFNIYSLNQKFTYKKFVEYQNLINHNKKYFIYSIEQLLNFKIFLKILYSWLKNCYFYILNRKYIKFYLKQKNSEYLHNFFLKDLDKSFLGLDSAVNFYYFYLFKNLSNNLDLNKNIFYLYENQSWEKSLVYNFKGKSKLVAVNHASIRYWDLRFCSDENCEKDVIPDVYAVNGDDSKQKLLNENYPIEKINKIEALRYFHILSDTKQNKKFENENNILLVSDYSDKSNENLLQAIGKIEKNILSNYKFTLKEHPLKSININNYSYINKTNLNFAELRKNNKIAIVSNTTSAVLDLYLLNYKIISIMDNNSINLSPMRKSRNISFLYNHNEITKILKNCKLDENNFEINNFFYLNRDLRFWKNILDANK